MKKRMKKVFVSILAATVISTATPSFASTITVNMPRYIYENRDIQHISSGVTHEKILRFTTAGWWNINVLRIDLNDRYTELKGLINPNGIPNRDKVSALVEKHGAIAGINGDYFNYQPVPSSMGTLISEGEMISSPIELAYALPTFYLTNSNEGGITYLDRKIVAKNLSNGKEVLINTINKATPNFDTVTLLNKHWGANSFGNKFHSDLVEVLVVDDRVRDVRIGGSPMAIPRENGYVLALRGQALLNFAVGDKVKLEVDTVPNIDNIKFAIGGGSIILKNGELSLTNINNKGNEPRTGIGINKDNTELILVTIDGRDSSFKGVSQEMFGAILRELGAYNALNLDGGGSTTMAIKPVDEEKATVVNKPSDGGERSVVNGVGVFSNAPVGRLSYLKVFTDDSNMFINTTRRFSVKGFDKYHNPVDIDDTKILFSFEGVEGTIDGNSFKPATSGIAKIIASYEDITCSIDINVLGTVKDISTKLNNFNIDINSEQELEVFYGKDKYGHEAKIYFEDINFVITGDIGYIEDGKFHSGDKHIGGAITAKVGDGVENILVSVGSKGILAKGFETMDDISFSAYPEGVVGSLDLSPDSREGVSSVALNYDFTQGTNTRAAYVNLRADDESPSLKLDGFPKKLGLWVKGDNSGSWLRGTIKDNKGVEHVIDFARTIDWTDWQYVITNIPSNVAYPITLERIYVVETDILKKPKGQLLFDGLTAFYPSPIGNMVLPTPTSLKDDINQKKSITKDGFNFIIGVEPKGLNELVGYDAASRVKSAISKGKIGILLNGASQEFKSGLKNYAIIDGFGNYAKTKHMNVRFINLNSSGGSIRTADPQQWINLTNDLNTFNESNIILFLPTPVFGANGFTDTLEADLLHKTLVKEKNKGKNIFVIQGSNTTSTDLKDGIRYIQLNTKELAKAEDIYDLSIIEFVVNGSDISYQINPLFESPKITVKK